MTKAKMSWDEFVEQARELRTKADEAQNRFMEFLYAGEQNRSMWADTGRTFEELIELANITKAVHYLRWKRVRENLGEEAVTGVGTEAVIAAGGLKTKQEQKAVIEQARTWEKTNGTRISRQSAQKMATETKILELGRRRAKSYSELHEENERLRAENAALKQENAALKAEIRKLKRSAKAA